MNDRFKFRAWDKKSKKIYNVTELGFISYKNFEIGHICLDVPDYEDWEILKNSNNCVLMQCTGLKDKNGVLIYEGDIISGINGSINGSGMEFKKIIKWDNANCCFNTPKFESNKNPTHWYEVIGNIYENPKRPGNGGAVTYK